MDRPQRAGPDEGRHREDEGQEGDETAVAVAAAGRGAVNIPPGIVSAESEGRHGKPRLWHLWWTRRVSRADRLRKRRTFGGRTMTNVPRGITTPPHLPLHAACGDTADAERKRAPRRGSLAT